MKVVALGNPYAGDDGAALRVGQMLSLQQRRDCDYIEAGRPGVGLLDLLEGEAPVILLDVVDGVGRPGEVIKRPLDALMNGVLTDPQTSSHGFGPSEVLKLGQTLQRTLPPGFFLGIVGSNYLPGESISISVQEGLAEFAALVLATIEELSPPSGETAHA